MPIAFFDLDRTLLSVNSASLWVRHEQRAGRIRWSHAVQAAGWVGLYHLGFSRMERFIEAAIASLQGKEEANVAARTLHFYEREIDATYRPGALAALQEHREAGHAIALLTSSSPYLCAPVQAKLGIEHVLCNRFEVVDGRFTGKPVYPLCFGPGKLDHAKRLAAELGEPLEACWFYTDSVSDASVMEVVGTPVAVNPDPALRRMALKKGWKVVDWGSTTS